MPTILGTKLLSCLVEVHRQSEAFWPKRGTGQTFWPKRGTGQNRVGQKEVWVRNVLARERYRSEMFWPNRGTGQKTFSPKRVTGQKRFSQKRCRSETFWLKIGTGQKRFGRKEVQYPYRATKSLETTIHMFLTGVFTRTSSLMYVAVKRARAVWTLSTRSASPYVRIGSYE